MVDERDIWLSALLHDVGKFWENVVPPTCRSACAYHQQARYQHEPFGA